MCIFSGEGMESTFTFTFDLSKTYTNSRNGAVEHTTVLQPQDNILVFVTKVPSNNWCIENTVVFTQEGIMATLKNLNTKVTTTKYYKRTTWPSSS